MQKALGKQVSEREIIEGSSFKPQNPSYLENFSEIVSEKGMECSKTYENLVVNNLEETRNFKEDLSLHERKIRYEKIRNKNFGIKHSKNIYKCR